MEQDKHVIRGPDLENTPDDEAPCIDTSCFRILLQQQPAHEKTAQRKEQVDALAAKAFQGIFDPADKRITGLDRVKVKAHYGDDRNAPHEVELDRPVRCLLCPWCAEQAHGISPFAAARAPRVSDLSSVFFPDSPGEIRRRFNLDWQSLNLRLSTPVSSANITPFTDRHCGLSHASDASGDCRALRCGNHPPPGIPGRQGFYRASSAAPHTRRPVDSRRRLVLNRLLRCSRFGHCYIPSNQSAASGKALTIEHRRRVLVCAVPRRALVSCGLSE